MTKPLSPYALAVVERADKLRLRVWSDPDWALLEAFGIETPTGVVHLHRMNYRGRGRWNLIVNPKRVGALCGTARCRVVTITPHGGENETCDISRQRYDDALRTWLDNKNLDRLVKRDILHAQERRLDAERKVRELIEAPYGPWPWQETSRRGYLLPKTYKWLSFGEAMHQLDLAMRGEL